MEVAPPVQRETHRRAELLLVSLPFSLAAFLVFFLLALRDWDAPPMPWDQRITRWIQGLPIPGLRRVMRVVSWAGWPPQNWLLTVASAVFLFRRGFRVAPWIVLAVLPVELGVTMVKAVVNRARPVQPIPGPRFWPADPSFPSGHTVQYTLLFGFLAYLTRLYAYRARVRLLGLGVFGTLIALIGPSRVYLGHHWPTDVLAGYSLGLGLLFSFVQLYELLHLVTRQRMRRRVGPNPVLHEK